MFGNDQLCEYDDGYMNGIGGAVGVPPTMGTLAYVPDLNPVGSGAAGTYYPRDTAGDAAALNYLGFYPDPLLAAHVGTKGSQAADMAASVGAWDPTFQQAVKDFQASQKISEDGWIGPDTRTRLGAAVAAKNANGGLVLPPVPNPTPGPLPSPIPGPTPVSTQSNNTLLYAAGGGLLLLGIGYLLTR